MSSCGELEPPVGAGRLVAEASHDLVVAVLAAHHQELLQLLRRLRQREEGARPHARRHEEVTRALGRGAAEHRRLDLDEPKRIEMLVHQTRHLVTQTPGSRSSRGGEGPDSGTPVAGARRPRRGLRSRTAACRRARAPRGWRPRPRLAGRKRRVDHARPAARAPSRVTRTTHSPRRSCATVCASVASSRVEDHLRPTPSRSRRSMNVDPAVIATVRHPAAQRHLAARRRPRGAPRTRVSASRSPASIARSCGSLAGAQMRRRPRPAARRSARRRPSGAAVTVPAASSCSPMIAANGGVGAVGHLELGLQADDPRTRGRHRSPPCAAPRRASGRSCGAAPPIATT